MSNSLGRNLKEGDVVFLQRKTINSKYDDSFLQVSVHGGFGMASFTSGSAILVEFKDGERTRWDADYIDKEATLAAWEEWGGRTPPEVKDDDT